MRMFKNLCGFIRVGGGVVILHERMDWYDVMGGVVVIGGVIGYWKYEVVRGCEKGDIAYVIDGSNERDE